MYHMSVLEAAFPKKKKKESLIFIYVLVGIGDL